MTLLHMEIPVSSLQDGLGFYKTLFAMEPQVLDARCAVFRMSDPPMSLRIVERQGLTPRPAGNHGHFGIQMKSSQALTEFKRRFEGVGVRLNIAQHAVECCGSVQNKLWVEDQDGNGWELFVVVEQAADGGCGDDVESCRNCPCNFA